MKTILFISTLFLSINLWAQIPNGYYDGDILKETDRDTTNPDNVILLYTGWSVNADQEYNSGSGWGREHVWAKSRGDFGTSQGAGTDCHHLRPCDISVNSARNNRWLAECDEQYYDDGGTIPTDSWTSSSEWIWKPRDAVKGDVARMIFYMATRYEGENGEPDLEVIDSIPTDNNTTEPIHALLSDLLAWNEQDPVDDFERNRNEIVYGYQGNRNPYIDHPEYVNKIWGSNTILPEPSNHVKDFRRVFSIKLSWLNQDNVDYYLIKMNTEGCGSFDLPIDGETYSNSYTTKIINGSINEYRYLVDTLQTYYFMLIPFNGSQGNENYKTDDTIPCIEFN